MGEVHKFPIKVYQLTANVASNANSTALGCDYWRLPLPPMPEETEKCSSPDFGCTCSSLDFWRLPLPTLGDDNELAFTAASNVASDDTGVKCGVCLIEFESGDEMRALPCGHCFHKD